MYKKGALLELQFAPQRLNSEAGDPYWIDLTRDEAERLHRVLTDRLAAPHNGTEIPLMFDLDDARNDATLASTVDAVAVDSGSVVSISGSGVETPLQQWVCVICGWIYDEVAGDPDHGLAPATRWADVPADWRCPLCDVGKEDFALVAF